MEIEITAEPSEIAPCLAYTWARKTSTYTRINCTLLLARKIISFWLLHFSVFMLCFVSSSPLLCCIFIYIWFFCCIDIHMYFVRLGREYKFIYFARDIITLCVRPLFSFRLIRINIYINTICYMKYIMTIYEWLRHNWTKNNKEKQKKRKLSKNVRKFYVLPGDFAAILIRAFI